MILIDTGPIVALLNQRDNDHAKCKRIAQGLIDTDLVTTWPCFTEAMYLLYRAGGLAFQDALWEMRTSGILGIHATTIAEENRMRYLMQQFSDSPMDMADASLVAASETLKTRRIFSLDSHFRAYRMQDGSAFELIESS